MRSFDGRGEARPLALAALLSIAPGCHSTSTYEGTPAPAAQASSPPLATSSPPSPSSPTAAVPSEHHATDPLLAHELVEYQAAPRELWGFLFLPPGPGPFPAMIFNHGSEELPGPKLGQAQFYVPQGFVVFVPHRRGQGRSKDAGPYIDTKADDPKAFVDELVAQSDDVLAAIDYIAAQPYVNPKQIAVSGARWAASRRSSRPSARTRSLRRSTSRAAR